MPYKFNENRRHKIPKARYRVTNWPEYDAALVRRGSLTVCFTEEAVAAWHAPATGERGGQLVYSALAIETGLALRLVFHQPLRQTEGMLRSIDEVLNVAIAVPDHTTLSRRSGGVTILPKLAARDEPLHLLVDSTRLKLYGEGEWLDQTHGLRSRRRWRKLHLGLDADTQEIVATESTPDDVGDVSVLPELLDQIDADGASMTADGAYDGEAAYNSVGERHPTAAVVIPSRARWCMNEPAAVGLPALRGLRDSDGDWHADPCHSVEHVALDLRLGPLIAQTPSVETPADDGLVSIHRGFSQAPRL